MEEQLVAVRVDRIMESIGGFIEVISNPELGVAAADPDLCDFLAGNPQEIASAQYVETLKRWAQPADKDWFAYKSGHRPAQVAAARGLRTELGMEFDPEDIILTRGAHGGLGPLSMLSSTRGTRLSISPRPGSSMRRSSSERAVPR